MPQIFPNRCHIFFLNKDFPKEYFKKLPFSYLPSKMPFKSDLHTLLSAALRGQTPHSPRSQADRLEGRLAIRS